MAEKPPLGLRPRYIAEEARLNEVCEAIARYYQAGYPFPMEWIEEYNELTEKVKKRQLTTAST
jgi:hypothetical protein